MKLSVVVLSALLVISCANKENKKISTPEPAKQIMDTSLYTIIPFDATNNYIFSDAKSMKPSSLSETEIQEIDTLLKEAVADYNKKNTSQYLQITPLATYKRQLVPVINQKGEKVIFVNCFCPGNWGEWKTQLVMVDDGGSCFFNLKINLTEKKVYDFGVNGIA